MTLTSLSESDEEKQLVTRQDGASAVGLGHGRLLRNAKVAVCVFLKGIRAPEGPWEVPAAPQPSSCDVLRMAGPVRPIQPGLGRVSGPDGRAG